MITFIPVPLLYWSHSLCMIYVLVIFGTSVYNGGEYYIEVFSRRYYRQFEQSDGDKAAGTQVRDFDADPPKMHRRNGSSSASAARAEDFASVASVTGPKSIIEPPPIVSDDEDDEGMVSADEEVYGSVMTVMESSMTSVTSCTTTKETVRLRSGRAHNRNGDVGSDSSSPGSTPPESPEGGRERHPGPTPANGGAGTASAQHGKED